MRRPIDTSRARSIAAEWDRARARGVECAPAGWRRVVAACIRRSGWASVSSRCGTGRRKDSAQTRVRGDLLGERLEREDDAVAQDVEGEVAHGSFGERIASPAHEGERSGAVHQGRTEPRGLAP